VVDWFAPDFIEKALFFIYFLWLFSAKISGFKSARPKKKE